MQEHKGSDAYREQLQVYKRYIFLVFRTGSIDIKIAFVRDLVNAIL